MAVSQYLDRDSPHSTSTFSAANPQPTMRDQSNVFRPPETPVSESYGSSSGVINRQAQSGVSAGRKRSRPDSAGSDIITPFSAAQSHWTRFSAESSALRSAAVSPPLLVNTRYNLRGGIDTPTAEADARFDFANQCRDEDYRRRGSIGQLSMERSEAFAHPVILGERNGRGRMPSSPNGVQSPSWGKFVFNIVGGVAGTMWEFCKATAFKGFYAGGGKGYDIPTPMRGEMPDSSVWEDMHAPRPRNSLEATPIPGQYPQEDYMHSGGSSERRPTKRLHTNTGTGWVIVTTSGDTDTPKSTSRIPIRRHSSIPNSAETKRSAASRPNMRRSLAPVSRRSLGVNHAGSPALNAHNRRASYAASRTPAAGTPTQNASPVSVEAQRYAERVRREERKTDASIKRLNDQLKAMIREGKEALASNVEVVDDEDDKQMEDEGFEDGIFGQQPVW